LWAAYAKHFWGNRTCAPLLECNHTHAEIDTLIERFELRMILFA